MEGGTFSILIGVFFFFVSFVELLYRRILSDWSMIVIRSPQSYKPEKKKQILQKQLGINLDIQQPKNLQQNTTRLHRDFQTKVFLQSLNTPE